MEIIKLIKTNLTVWFTLIFLTAFPQEGVVSPACWLRADSIRQGDTVWRDMSNHGLHAIPQSGMMPAALGSLNFNPCILLQESLHFVVRFDSLYNDKADVIVVY